MKKTANKEKTVFARIDPDTFKMMEVQAERQGHTVSSYVRKSIQNEIMRDSRKRRK